MNDFDLERLAKQADATVFLVPVYRDALSRFADEVVRMEGRQWRTVIAQREREIRRDEEKVIAAFKERAQDRLERAIKSALKGAK